MPTPDAVSLVSAELAEIESTWGAADRGDGVMLAVLVEEVGEVARALQDDPQQIQSELVQVAAVAIRWHTMIEARYRD